MKRLLYIVLGLALVLIVGLFAAPFLIPSSTIARMAADQVKEATGRDLVITGDIDRRVFPSLGVSTGAVTLSNADWASEPNMVSVKELVVDVDTWSVLTGDVVVQKIRLVEPIIHLEVSPDGEKNWEFDAAATGEGSSDADGGGSDGGGGLVTLLDAEIIDGAFSYADRATGQLLDLQDIDVAAALPSPDAALTLQGGANWNGERAELAGAFDSSQKMQAGDPVFANLELTAPGATLGFEGSAEGLQGDAPSIAGDFIAQLSGDEAETGWLRRSLPPAAEPLGAIDLSGNLDFGSNGAAATLGGDIAFNERAISIDGDVTGGADWSSGGEINTRLALVSEGLLNGVWAGVVALPDSGPAADGKLKLKIPRVRALADWAGVGPIEAPAGVLQRLSLDADVSYAAERAELSLTEFMLDETEATGVVAADLSGDRPAIDATLATGPLDLRPFTASGTGDAADQGAAPAASEGWSDAPLPLVGLKAVDAVFDIDAQSVVTDTVQLGRTAIKGTLQNGKLDATLEELQLYEGGAKGSATVDASGEIPQIAAQLDANAIQMLPLLNDMADLSVLEGIGRVRLDVAGSGGSMKALMSSLNGDGELLFEDGAILGVNLAAMVRNVGTAFLDPSGGEVRKTDFAELSGTFDIVNGVIQNPDLSLLGPLLRVAGVGEIDLSQQTLDYRLTPRAVASLVGQGGDAGAGGLTFPVLVSGPWSNLSFQPDVGNAIEGILNNPEDALEGLQGLTEGVTGGVTGGGLEGALGGALQNLGGGQGEGTEASEGGAQNPVGGLIEGVLGGGQSGGGSDAPAEAEQEPAAPNPAEAIRGLFGN